MVLNPKAQIALISHPACLLHEMGPSHPEQPARLKVIEHALLNSEIATYLKQYTASLATRQQLVEVHDAAYVDQLFKLAPKEGLIGLDPDTWMNPFSLSAALHAAGALIQGVDVVMAGEVRAAFCNVRPPGHHAERAQAMGFCFFNNVAVGVAHALNQHGLKRVAIVDFDVHHGNGTENIFKNDERVLLCSSFQSPFYPFSGEDTKRTHILNLPLPAGTDGKYFRDQAKKHWFKKIEQFKPEMIFFSAGFDAHTADDMANMNLIEEDYAWITQKVRALADQLCEGRMVSTLEGGYALNVLGHCALAHVRALKI
jgi:acetoin utilization deacetylase AcuC-like enzyme